MTVEPPRILSIAGSDSGGGAGIQADIKTASALGCYAMTAVTAITAQNTQGVRSIVPVPPAVVREQIAMCLQDIGADAIKIGMLGDVDVIDAVAEALGSCASGIPLVVDPVMIAKGGSPLLAEKAVDALKSKIVPLASVLTPNLPEAHALLGRSGEASSRELGQRLLSLGCKSVLVKGGHADGPVVEDWLFSADGGAQKFEAPRIESSHTHGTGCTLSTAIACGLGQGMSLIDAVARSHAYVHEAIRAAPGFGSGHGPLNHMHGKVR
ncbi:MAG TPA: bifunctional hydroxymethylpyrimidine kinase/phosphomethylpyrimidine kinase [Rhizomicrobium sp.]|nr:bifunctional hydroxymethylpyrimidine kinase/phosphomethylpyrimidine kinase [Rhizomicrobium sp.]